jgi:hypothetical protein
MELDSAIKRAEKKLEYLSSDDIAEVTGLSMEEIKTLQAKSNDKTH